MALTTGVEKLNISPTAIFGYVPIIATTGFLSSSGNAAAPSFSFQGNSSTGLYNVGWLDRISVSSASTTFGNNNAILQQPVL